MPWRSVPGARERRRWWGVEPVREGGRPPRPKEGESEDNTPLGDRDHEPGYIAPPSLVAISPIAATFLIALRYSPAASFSMAADNRPAAPGRPNTHPAWDTSLPTIGRGARLRSQATRLSHRLRSSPYIVRWLVLGGLVGGAAGLVVVAFARAILFSDRVLLDKVGGYLAPTVAAEGGRLGSLHVARPWAIPLVVGLGGALAGLIALVVPEAAGSGTDDAVRAVHENPRALRLRSIPAKIVASAATIGSGGSAGPEGPSAQVAAAVGSALTRFLDLPATDGRVAVAIGIGSGIGCVFRAPLGGALLSAEILYRQDFEVDVLIPSFIASVVAYTVFSVFEGFSPLMGFVGQYYVYSHPIRLAWFLIIGVIGALVGLLYAQTLTATRHLAGRLRPGRMATVLRPAVGGLAVGALAVGLPGVLGSGDGWAQEALTRSLLLLPLWFVLAMPLAKLAATALSVGTGGSGGLFSPGMVIGAFVGASVWRLLRGVAPSVPHDPAPFVIIGMMCCLGSVSRAPLAVTVMVAEMTSSIGIVIPALLAVGVATLIVGQTEVTLIDAQLHTRDDAPARRLVRALPLLASVPVSAVMQPPRSILPAQADVVSAAEHLGRIGVPGAPVADEAGQFIGTVSLADLQAAAAADPMLLVARSASREATTASFDERLSEAAHALLGGGDGWVTVVDHDRHVVGVLTTTDLVRGYRHALASSVRRVAQLEPTTSLLELTVEEGSSLSGRPLRSAGLPPGVLLVTVVRAGSLILPDADTELEVGDRVGALAPRRLAPAVRALFSPATNFHPSKGVHETATPPARNEGPALPDETLPDETLPGETLQGETLPGETLQGETLQGETLQGEIAGESDPGREPEAPTRPGKLPADGSAPGHRPRD